jgi:hypothetical protein
MTWFSRRQADLIITHNYSLKGQAADGIEIGKSNRKSSSGINTYEKAAQRRNRKNDGFPSS